jgi:Domain of unknown function (DUF4350)
VTRRAWIVVGGVVGAVVAVNVLLVVLDRLTEKPSGPASSSYATAPHGLAAYADLLRRAGHPVVRLRDVPAEADLDPASTVVVLDPESPDVADAEALRAFVEGGGRLLAGGALPNAWLDELVDVEPTWSGAPVRESVPLAPLGDVSGVRTVRAAGPGSWSGTGEALPAAGDAGRTLLAVASPGRGRLVLLADASPLQNRLLDEADNAALGLALAGPRRRPVAFVESVHGYGPAAGLTAIPERWLFALGGLVLAVLVFMVARGRRLGPPEREDRALPPPRREYVESLAAVLARTKRPGEAAEPVRAEARARIAARAGLDADPGDGALREAGRRLGLSEPELAAVLEGGGDVVTAGRTLAKLGAGDGR